MHTHTHTHQHPYLDESVVAAQHFFQVFAGHVFDALQRVPGHAYREGLAVFAFLAVLGSELCIGPLEARFRKHVGEADAPLFHLGGLQ